MSLGMESMSLLSNNKIGENGVDIQRENLKFTTRCSHLHMTSNLMISRGCQDESGKEMYPNVKRMCWACRAIFFANYLLFCGILVAVVVVFA